MNRPPALPPGAEPLTERRLAVLCAVAVQPRPTFRSVAAYTGMTHQEARRYCAWLRDLGLVAWTPGRRGTLRPLFELVPVR